MSTKLLTASLLALLLILQPCSATYNVHFTFHSHDDVGWLNTADEYYTGTSNGYPFTASVKNTLDQARSALNLNSNRIFIPVEMYFFRKWYNALDSTGKANVRDLIKNNQFQITNGGWVMNDEGAAYYEDIIDQFTLGHRFTYKEFGVIPKIGWHIDPFGHSGGQVNIFGQMGFDAWFFERIDYQEMSQKKQNGNLEFMWTPKTALGELNSMFSHINYQKYVNYPMRTGLSPSQLKDSFKTFLDGATKGFKSQTIFHHAGDDFVIISDSDYKEIETMIASFNSDSSSNFKISISSPQMYIDDLYSQARSGKFNISALDTKTDDDFFPYEDVAGAYWTGYFTSRPYLKYMIRESGRMLRNTQKFVSLMSLPQQTMKTSYSTILKKFQDTLFPLYDALAMGQHHDAITGTARTNVNRDYLQRISNGLSAATTYLNDVVNNLKDTTNSVTCAMSHNYDVPLNDNCKTFYTALFSITTQPSVTARVLVFNPRASDAALVRFWVQKYVHTVSVVANGVTQEVASSMVCDLQAFSFASDAYTTAPCQLFVEVSVGAYSTVEFVITAKRGSEEVTQLSGSALNANGTVVIDSTTSIGLSANSSTFQLTSGSESYSFAISYQVYPIGYGSVNSGAYLLKTSSTTKSTYNVFSSMKSYNSSSFVLIEMISDVSQVTKVSALLIFHKNYVSSKGIHIISTIPAMPSTGEMVLNIKVNGFTNSQNAFHTDMNGYEMIKRVIGYRKSGVQIQDSISGNYYPMYSAMYTDDDGSSKRMLLMTDRTQSVSSFEPGQVEVLLQRRAQADDERGVAETYVDSTSVITHHYLFFGSTSHLDIIQRQKQVEIDQPFLVLAGSVSTSSSTPNQLFPYLQSNITSRIAQTQCETASRSTLKLNFEPLDTAGEYLLKVQNLHPTASTSVTLKSISESTSSLLECAIGLQTQSISKLTVTDMTEMTITGVEKLTDMLARRKYWKCTESDATKCQEQLQNSVFAYTENTANTKIATLLPMQMRVFKFTVNPEGLSDTTVAPPMATGAVHLVGFVALWSYIIGAILVGL